MEIRTVIANQHLNDDIGKIALQRGPLIYCAEWIDNNGKTSNIILPASTNFTSVYRGDLLNGVTVLNAEAPTVVIRDDNNISMVKQKFTAIPYYSWANRGKGEMMIWFPEKVKSVELNSN
jgi:hypothetical protein